MEDITYEQASKELDGILSEIKSEKISIDKLAEKVERAAILASFCSKKLRATETKINEIIDNLNL